MKIALLSPKGGVGKTTTAVNLAAALARRGRRVLLVDVDAQASASQSLGVERAQLSPSLADVLNNQLTLTDAIRKTGIEGLDLVTASADLTFLDFELAQTRRREHYLVDPLETVERSYDFVFLDCPSGLSLLPMAALVASDAYLVPISPQFLVVAGLPNFLDSIERLRVRAGVRPRLLGVLITQADYRARLTRECVDSLRRDYGTQVFGIEIRVNVRLAEAPGHGLSVFDHDPSSTGARAYDLLADELLLRSSSRSFGPQPIPTEV